MNAREVPPFPIPKQEAWPSIEHGVLRSFCFRGFKEAVYELGRVHGCNTGDEGIAGSRKRDAHAWSPIE